MYEVKKKEAGMYKRMLVPVDGSKLAEEVLPYARDIAGRMDMELIFLNVCNPHEAKRLHVRQFYVDKMAEMAQDQTREVQTATGTPVNIMTGKSIGKVVVGYPAAKILRYSEENPIDIILMATKGTSGVRHRALGSVASKVLHASRKPVLLVRSGIPQETVYDKWTRRTVLVPLDGSELAESALLHAEALAKQKGIQTTEILLVNVCEPDLLLEQDYYLDPKYLPNTSLKYEDYVQRETAKTEAFSRQYLERISERFKLEGIKVRTEILVGDAAEEIIEYANQNPFQVIVMASHGRSGLKHLALGSVAEKVLLQTKTPVLIVKPPDFKR